MLRVLVAVVVFTCTALSHDVQACDPYNPDGSCKDPCGNYGDVIGTYSGVHATVQAKSNGDWTGGGCGDHQCVAFVRRFFIDEVQHTLGSLPGGAGSGDDGWAVNAYNDWPNNSSLLQFANGVSTTPPAPGDIYCQSGGTYGHIGIVKSVNLQSNPMTVVIIDQNRSASSAELPRNLYVDGQGRYSIAPISLNYTTQGWLRDQNYNVPAYACAYDSQSPSGLSQALVPGQTFACEVKFRNVGTAVWRNNVGSYPNDYVELKSCSQSGTVEDSFLNYPYDATLGWLNSQSPCTMVESSRSNGEIATFQFTGRVRDDATPGVHYVYFRPNHSTGGLMQDWGGMNFQVNVVAPTGAAADALVYDWQLGTIKVALNDGTSFTGSAQWEDGWDTGGSSDHRIFTTGTGADPYENLGICEIRTGNWYENTSQGADFVTKRTLVTGWKANSTNDPKYQYLMRDVSGDGYPDGIIVGSHTGNVFVAKRNGNALEPDATQWISSFHLSSNPAQFQFFAGKVADADAKADIIVREVSTGNWWVAKSTGTSFTAISGQVLSNWASDNPPYRIYQFAFADFDGDGTDEIIAYRPDTGTINGAKWSGTGFTSMGALKTSWGTSATDPVKYRLLTGDLDHNGLKDVVLFKADGGNWYSGISDGTSIVSTFTGRTNFGNSLDTERYSPLLFDVGLYQGGGIVYFGIEDPPIVDGTTPRAPTFTLSPNPGRGEVAIQLHLPATTQVDMAVYDVTGKRVAALLSGVHTVGTHSITWNARNLPAGVYFCRVTAQGKALTQKLVLLK